MSKIVVAVGGTLALLGGVAMYWQHLDNTRLRQEIALLRAEVKAAATARAESAGARPAATAEQVSVVPDRAFTSGEDVATLREEIASLRKSAHEISKFVQIAQAAAAAKSLQNADSSVAVDLKPVGTWKHSGKATPEAGAETALWAAAGGEVDTLADSLTFTVTARAKADAWFASLSENTRQQYGSPEKVIALMIAKDAAALSGMQVIGQKNLTPDDVGLRMRFASNEGKTKEDTFVMHRTNDGWRLLLSDPVVEKFAKQIGGRGK